MFFFREKLKELHELKSVSLSTLCIDSFSFIKI